MKKYSGLITLAAVVFLNGCSGEQPASEEQVMAAPPNYLIMLTEAEDNMADASFMSVETLEECETRAAAAMKVFPVAEIKYISHYCTNAQVAFEPFLHNPEPTGANYIFDLEFSVDGKALENVAVFPSMEDCERADGKVCVISYQNLL